MSKDEIIAAAMELDATARAGIAIALLDTTVPHPDTEQIVNAAYRVCGVEQPDSESRRNRAVDARSIIAYALNKGGLSDGQIGGIIGKERTTALYMRRRMQDALKMPIGNPLLIARYTEFNKIIYAY